jgi:hypothetical protein
MNRKIVDYKKLTPEILSLLVDRYPDGYDDNHIITFKNANNDTIEAVEVRTDDTIYLVKVSSRLVSSMANYDEDDYDSSDLQRPIQEIDDDLAADADEEEDEE